LFPCFFGLKNYDFGVIFTPARGKAFSGTENGFVCYKTHLAILYKFLTLGKTSKLALLSLNRNFLTKIEIRP